MSFGLIKRMRVPDEFVFDDGTSDLVVSVSCQDERHLVRLTAKGQLAFDHHDDIGALAAAGEAAALAQEPQFVRCGEILIVWRYWQDMAKKFPGASRTFGLPQPLISARAAAFRLRGDRQKWRESEEKRMHRERSAFMNKVYRRMREKRERLTAYDRFNDKRTAAAQAVLGVMFDEG